MSLSSFSKFALLIISTKLNLTKFIAFKTRKFVPQVFNIYLVIVNVSFISNICLTKANIRQKPF